MGTMFIDHAAVAVIYDTGLDSVAPIFGNLGLAMRLIGRMAFPLYAFMLAQGFLYTKNWKKYLARVAVFAVLSEIPFNLISGGKLFYPAAQNTMVTMCLGLLCMKGLAAVEKWTEGISFGDENGYCIQKVDRVCKAVLQIIINMGILLFGMFAAEILCADYGAYGILLIAVFCYFRYRIVEQMGIGCLLLGMMYNFSIYAPASWIAFFFINRYNGERGRKLGMVPYAFYPLHLLALFIAARVLVHV